MEIKIKLARAWWVGVLVAVVGLAAAGYGGGGDSSGEGAPADGLNVNGFWEGLAPNGTTAAATFVQQGGNITSDSIKVNDTGKLVGTLNGYHMKFNLVYDDGSTVPGEGDFDAEGMNFTGNMPAIGSFELSWRGPSFEQHNPLGEPLTYSKE